MDSNDLLGAHSRAETDDLVAAVVERDAHEARLRLAVAEWAATRAWEAEGATSATTWLAWRTGVTRSTARRLLVTGRFVAAHPDTRAAAESGALGPDQLDALSRTLTERHADLYSRDEAVILGAAERCSADDFALAIRRWRDRADDALDQTDSDADDRSHLWASKGLFGRVHGGFDLDPDSGARVLAALDDLSTPDPADSPEGVRTPGERRADALVDLADRHLVGADVANRNGRGALATTAVIDFETLLGYESRLRQSADSGTARCCSKPAEDDSASPGNPTPTLPSLPPSLPGGGHDAPENPGESVDIDLWLSSAIRRFLSRRSDLATLGPVSAANIARAACSGPITRVVLGSSSAVLDLGRATYRFNRQQRRAIAARDDGCVVPWCRRPVHWCDTHHVTPWDDGGHTNVASGVLLCRRHHTLIHRTDWVLRQTADSEGGFEIVAPDGRVWPAAHAGQSPRPPTRGDPPSEQRAALAA